MDHSPENHTGRNEQPEQAVPGRTELEKEREIKEDGRYLIYYDFGDDGEQEGRGA